ncbi:MAG TPA: phosphatase PAP2-related protein [Candidatus Acidoferrum sp.]|nr:phosphatase PAP2-related protein [Candidatus Acidoferrum sp.]
MTQTQEPLNWPTLLRRLVVTAIVLVIWFWTQSLIGARAAPASGLGDGLHSLTAGLNSYFARNAGAADLLLIVSSGLIDALGLFLLARWLFGGTVRPFLGLFMLIVLRQILQAICALPAPPGMIWHYPGFPSLLVTYHVANDFFFSGHTAIAVFAAVELARFRRKWLTVMAILIVIFEVATVLILRAHYTMDVFTGAVTAFWISNLSERVSPRIDSLLHGYGLAHVKHGFQNLETIQNSLPKEKRPK